MTVNVLGHLTLTIQASMIEWEPKNWSDRKAWGSDTPDGFYVTKAGEIYRLSGNVVVYVTKEELND